MASSHSPLSLLLESEKTRLGLLVLAPKLLLTGSDLPSLLLLCHIPDDSLKSLHHPYEICQVILLKASLSLKSFHTHFLSPSLEHCLWQHRLYPNSSQGVIPHGDCLLWKPSCAQDQKSIWGVPSTACSVLVSPLGKKCGNVDLLPQMTDLN